MERNTIDLSIIIPVYNTPLTFLKECLESISNSKIEYPYEIIIVNDGSTHQEIIDFLNHYTEEHTKIIHKENSGVSATRNVGLAEAKGKYIFCLDSDDILLPEINSAISFLKNNHEYSVVYGDWQYFGDENFTYKPGQFSKFKHIYIGIQPHTSSLFRRSILNTIHGFNENFETSEDWDFWGRIAVKGFKFKYHSNPLFLWRKIRDGKSLSQKSGQYERREIVLTEGKKQFNPHKEITLKEVNKYVLNNFRDNKKHIIKLFLIIFFPSIFKLLIKFKIYKNDFVVD